MRYPSTSARCRRPISASTASAGDVRPSSTAAICAAIGSSMPCRAPSASAAPVVRHAFRDHVHAAQDLVERAAAAELDADLPIAAQTRPCT